MCTLLALHNFYNFAKEKTDPMYNLNNWSTMNLNCFVYNLQNAINLF